MCIDINFKMTYKSKVSECESWINHDSKKENVAAEIGMASDFLQKDELDDLVEEGSDTMKTNTLMIIIVLSVLEQGEQSKL